MSKRFSWIAVAAILLGPGLSAGAHADSVGATTPQTEIESLKKADEAQKTNYAAGAGAEDKKAADGADPSKDTYDKAKKTPPTLEIDVYAQSAAFDRGKQIAADSAKLSVAGNAQLSKTLRLKGGVRHLEPVGSDDDVYNAKTEVFAEIVGDAKPFVWTAGLTHREYEGQDGVIEAVGEFVGKAPGAPALRAFANLDDEEWGLEVSAGPSWKMGKWKGDVRFRYGYGDFLKGDRTYAGLFAVGARKLSGNAKLKVFASLEATDEKTFDVALDYKGKAKGTERAGAAVGVVLAFGF